ncbi:hypothetical protein ACFT54_09845 [Streptomyces cinereoruber]|uniref:hypothetical protein n=1 Tax=Streptomyces cinereoruber TaxID=67260 RepID=UPI003631A3B4
MKMTEAPTAARSTAGTGEQPAAVYRLWAEDGSLLYIGSAYNPEGRCKGHQSKPWWPLVASRTDEWHATREAAYAAEREAIPRESPAHNVFGTPRHTGPAARGKVQREATEARWHATYAALHAGASRAEARLAGGLAEVEHLESSGLLPDYAAKLRAQIERGEAGDQEELPPEVTRLLDAFVALAEIEDDAACTYAVSAVLRQWPDLGSALRQLREDRVNALRYDRGQSWGEIAEIIGDVTSARAQQISKGLSGARRKKDAAVKAQPGK